MILTIIIALLLSIFFHEIGHLFYFHFELKNPVNLYFYYNNWRSFGIKIGQPKDYVFLSASDLAWVYSAGIIWGLIPIMLFYVFGFLNNFSFTLTYFLYFIGCKSDLMSLYRIAKSTKIKYQELRQ